MITKGLLSAGLTQAGGMGAISPTSVTASGTITAASFVQSGGAGADGWNVGVAAPNTVTANGNRSYSLVFNSTDYTGTLSPGMRLRTTRTVAAPTQCTSLNGTNQYYSKTSPAGMTFNDDFVVSAWVKVSSYPTATAGLVSRYNGTSGWYLRLDTTGQIMLIGHNAGSGNYSYVQSYQSLPLNKWVHVTAQLDMSAFTATSTTSYVMFDGVDVPASVSRAGTNPTALVQAGNLEVGSFNAGGFAPVKIAQVAIYNAKVTQANIRATISQGLSGSETSLISAYSFNNSINDLNTGNANNLTANGSAVATNADSPFGTQASGSISSTLDYAIIQSASFSTNTTLTVQVPEGCTIPTSGGVSAVVYSSNKAPYGFPSDRNKWTVLMLFIGKSTVSWGGGAWTTPGWSYIVPIGNWTIGFRGYFEKNDTVSNPTDIRTALHTASSGTPTNASLQCSIFDYAATQYIGNYVACEDYVSLTSATTYYAAQYIAAGTSVTGFYGGANATRGDFRYYAENAYL